MRLFSLVALGLLLSLGCKKEPKAPTGAGTLSDGVRQHGGDGGGVSGVVGAGGGAAGGSVMNRVHREKSLLHLRQLYVGYMLCIATNGSPPRDADELKANLEGGDRFLKSPRDDKPYEIAFGVDPAKLSTSTEETLIAWETLPDSEGFRCALQANGTPVALKDDAFQKKTRPKK